MSVSTSASLWTLLSLWVLVSASEVQNITADPGQTVTLPCRAPNTNIIVVEWTRPDLEPEYVFLQRGTWSGSENQNPSFQNRVELVDRQMKDGDVSLTLKNVTREDTGRYKCHVIQRETNRRKRAISNTENIYTIYLDIKPGNTQGDREEGGDTEGDSRGHVGLVVAGLSVVAVVAVVCGILMKRRMKKNRHLPPPPDEEAGDQA